MFSNLSIFKCGKCKCVQCSCFFCVADQVSRLLCSHPFGAKLNFVLHNLAKVHAICHVFQRRWIEYDLSSTTWSQRKRCVLVFQLFEIVYIFHIEMVGHSAPFVKEQAEIPSFISSTDCRPTNKGKKIKNKQFFWLHLYLVMTLKKTFQMLMFLPQSIITHLWFDFHLFQWFSHLSSMEIMKYQRN